MIYYFILAIWIFFSWFLKKRSTFSLYPAFVLFVLAALFVLFGERSLAETFMRLSLVGWLIGIPHALIEVVNKKD